MSNQNTSTRRRFIKQAAGASAAVGLAGCSSSENSNLEGAEEQQSSVTEEVKNEITEEEFLTELKSTAFDIQESLSRTHNSPRDQEMVELSGNDDHLTLSINEDLGELIRGSTHDYNNADLYIASEFGIADEVLNDARPELGVTADLLDSELGSLEEETQVPDDYDFHIQVNIHGRGDANAGPNWEYGTSTAEQELEELYNDAADSGKRQGFATLSHGVYDEFSTLSEGEAQTIDVNGVEHTVEYVETINEDTADESGVLRVDGEITMVDDYDSFSLDGEEYRVETNPVYVQDREDVEDGVLIRES
jgi:hypothetical protein